MEKRIKEPYEIDNKIREEIFKAMSNRPEPIESCIGCLFEDAWPGCPAPNGCNWGKQHLTPVSTGDRAKDRPAR